MQKRNIGLLGMSGNPTHAGHIATVARALQSNVGLDEVWLLINPHNPTKDPAQYAPFSDRMQLARYELAANPVKSGWVDVSDYEESLRYRDVPNESIWTLRQFEKDHPGYNPVWMQGGDILTEMHTWGGEWSQIFEEYPVIVLSRPNDSANDKVMSSVAARAHIHLYREQDAFACEKGTWTFLDTADHPGSSTAVRTAMAEGRRPRHVCPKSYEHMMRHGLYGAKNRTDQ